MYHTVLSMVGHDVLEVFGPSGSGKTTFAFAIAIGALREGKKVVFIDTERNVDEHIVERLKRAGVTYYYVTDVNNLFNLVQNLPEADVYILDSLGMPVLRHFARVNAKERGEMLLKAIALAGVLKQVSHDNNALVLITNQPESEFAKAPGTDLAPFGDKHIFDIKEIWRTSIVEAVPGKTVTQITAWRSRRFAKGTPIARVTITNDGVKIGFVKGRGRSGLEALIEQAVAQEGVGE